MTHPAPARAAVPATVPATIPATINVELGARRYPVHLGHHLLDAAGALLGPSLRRPGVVVVTDQIVAATPHPARLGASLAAAGIESRTIVVPAGEGTKAMPQLAALLDDILGHGVERSLTLIALGGGVVGDLVGFAAAILLRGLDYVQVPTTLLAQVDSSVGGKTGVNSRHGKNLIGAFHQPIAVLIDTATLSSLPARELRAGYAEVVKHAFIRDADYFASLETSGSAVLAGEPDALLAAIRRSVEIKAAIVAGDETETKGLRALLNFGHTFAHAFEALHSYDGRLLHGEAVSLGLVCAFRLSERLGLCPAEDAARAIAHLQRLGLPTRLADLGLAPPPADAVVDAMARDKKVADAKLRFVLSRGIGHAFADAEVQDADLRAALLAAGG